MMERGPDGLTRELYFLIAKFLRNGPLKETYATFVREAESLAVFPCGVKFTGELLPHSFTKNEAQFSHISDDHLLNLSQRFCAILQAERVGQCLPICSLLGVGRYTLLRDTVTTAGAAGNPLSACRKSGRKSTRNAFCTDIYNEDLTSAQATVNLLIAQFERSNNVHWSIAKHVARICVPESYRLLFNELLRRLAVECAERPAELGCSKRDREIREKTFPRFDNNGTAQSARRRGVEAERETDAEAEVESLCASSSTVHSLTGHLVWRAPNPGLVMALRLRSLGGAHGGLPSLAHVQANSYHFRKRVLGHLAPVYCVIFDRSSTLIITGSDDGLVKLWNATTAQLQVTLRGHVGEIVDLAVNNENTLLASGSCDKTVRIWCLATVRTVAVLTHSGPLTSIQFSPLVRGTNRWLVSTSQDGCVAIWRYTVTNGEFLAKPIKFDEKSRPGAHVLCGAFSPGGRFFAAGSTDHAVRVYFWLGDFPEKIGELEGHTDRVDSIAFSNGAETRFATGSRDGTARIWRFERGGWRSVALNCGATPLYGLVDLLDSNDANRRQRDSTAAAVVNRRSRRAGANRSNDVDELAAFEFDSPPPRTQQGVGGPVHVTMIAWTSDDSRVIVASSDLLIHVFDTHRRIKERSLRVHTAECYTIETSASDSRFALTAAKDGSLAFLDITAGLLLRRWRNTVPGRGDIPVLDARFSEGDDNSMLAAVDEDGHVLIFASGCATPQRYLVAPEEQFFHTDYNGVTRDTAPQPQRALVVSGSATNRAAQCPRVVDVRYHREAHELPPAFLVNSAGLPYDTDVQRLVPGREQLPTQHLAPRITYDAEDNLQIVDDEETMLTLNTARGAPPALHPAQAAVPAPAPNAPVGERHANLPSIIDLWTARGLVKKQTERWEIDERERVGVAELERFIAEWRKRPRREDIRIPDDVLPRAARRRGDELGDSPMRGLPYSNFSSATEFYTGAHQPPHAGPSDCPSGSFPFALTQPSTQPDFPANLQPFVPIEQTVVNRLTHKALYDTEYETESGEEDGAAAASANRDAQKRKRKKRFWEALDQRSDMINPVSYEPSSADEQDAEADDAASSAVEPEAMRRRGAAQSSRRRQPSATESAESVSESESDSDSSESSECSDWAGNDADSSLRAPARRVRRSHAAPSRSKRAKRAQTGSPRKPAARRERQGTSSARRRDESPERRAGLRERRKPPRYRTVSSSERASGEENEEDADADNQDDDTVKPKRSRYDTRRRRTVRHVHTHESESETEQTINKKAASRSKPASASATARRLAARGEVVHEKVESLLQRYAPPDWLTNVQPKRTPYVPQIGDLVLYFRQGHAFYVNAVRENQLYQPADRDLPWNKLTNLPAVVLARVNGAKYEWVKGLPIRLCHVRLRIIDQATRRQTDNQFVVKYHDVDDVLDFIVLEQYYERAKKDWKIGDRCRSLIESAWWVGTVMHDGSMDPEFPDSPFNKYTVHWDSDEQERVSCWDIEPLSEADYGAAASNAGEDGRTCTPEELEGLLYRSSPEEWNGRDPRTERQRIIECLRKLQQLSVAEDFNAPVDLQSYPLYAKQIAYMVDLSTIRQRLENAYYRRVEAVQFDCRTLANNAERFNLPRAAIVRKAQLVSVLCERFITNSNCVDIMPHYHELVESMQLEDENEQEISDREHGRERDEDHDRRRSARQSSRNSASNNVDQHKRSRATESKPSSNSAFKRNAVACLEELGGLDCSEPFRLPVDTLYYADYLSVVREPIDLMTIKERVETGLIATFDAFALALRQIIINSRAYNPNSRTPIYEMTTEFSKAIERRLHELMSHPYFDDSCAATSSQQRSLRRSDSLAAKRRTEVDVDRKRAAANKRRRVDVNESESDGDEDVDEHKPTRTTTNFRRTSRSHSGDAQPSNSTANTSGTHSTRSESANATSEHLNMDTKPKLKPQNNGDNDVEVSSETNAQQSSPASAPHEEEDLELSDLSETESESDSEESSSESEMFAGSKPPSSRRKPQARKMVTPQRPVRSSRNRASSRSHGGEESTQTTPTGRSHRSAETFIDGSRELIGELEPRNRARPTVSYREQSESEDYEPAGVHENEKSVRRGTPRAASTRARTSLLTAAFESDDDEL